MAPQVADHAVTRWFDRVRVVTAHEARAAILAAWEAGEPLPSPWNTELRRHQGIVLCYDTRWQVIATLWVEGETADHTPAQRLAKEIKAIPRRLWQGKFRRVAQR